MLFQSVLCALALTASTPEKPYSVDLTGTTAALKAGSPGHLQMQIKPAEGYKISREAPLKVTLSAEGVALAKSKLGQKDAGDKKDTAPTFKVAFTSGTAGTHKIAGKATFFVCNENLCERKSEEFGVVIKTE